MHVGNLEEPYMSGAGPFDPVNSGNWVKYKNIKWQVIRIKSKQTSPFRACALDNFFKPRRIGEDLKCAYFLVFRHERLRLNLGNLLDCPGCPFGQSLGNREHFAGNGEVSAVLSAGCQANSRLSEANNELA